MRFLGVVLGEGSLSLFGILVQPMARDLFGAFLGAGLGIVFLFRWTGTGSLARCFRTPAAGVPGRWR